MIRESNVAPLPRGMFHGELTANGQVFALRVPVGGGGGGVVVVVVVVVGGAVVVVGGAVVVVGGAVVVVSRFGNGH